MFLVGYGAGPSERCTDGERGAKMAGLLMSGVVMGAAGSQARVGAFSEVRQDILKILSS